MSPTILLVDDDPADVLFLQRALRQAGIANPLAVAAGGEAAIQVLTLAQKPGRQPPFLVFLDLTMPKIDGFAVLSWMRRQAALQDVVVVALSALERPGELERVYELGARSFLSKPATAAGVRRLVDSMASWWGCARARGLLMDGGKVAQPG